MRGGFQEDGSYILFEPEVYGIFPPKEYEKRKRELEAYLQNDNDKEENRKTRIIIAGGRKFSNQELFDSTMNNLMERHLEAELVSGHASGADKMAERYAEENGIPITVMPAEWEKYGRSAGSIRNGQMIEYALQSNGPMLVAFWDGHSKGTKNIINQAKKNAIKTQIVLYK